MAASVAGVTPVKTYVCFKKCMLCNSDTRRLHVLSKNKAVNANFKDIIQDCLSVELDLEVFDLMHVCDPCVNTCEKYLKFKTESVKNLEENKKSVCRTKRQAKTPPSLLKLSISPSSRSVASQIERSVEKLKRMRIEDGECKTRTGVSRSRVQLQFNGVDHQYTKRHSGKVANQEQFSSPESILHDIQENVPTYCQSIGKQLQSVCKPGHSLLFNKDPGDLMEKNWFTEIILEMKRICPDFLSLLSCAVGDAASAESKLATIATVYGMVMHSRNVRASAIQRLYTALAIRFHADNKFIYLHEVSV
ncbi:uncharacterized protein LOC110462891 [Mizuhopecten yessoensis]|uniref:uncharacterized protein LOC110462891 n=1 Tax=Mizuhopecten yessoensis TaxID=6573 RepID=UPI000B45DF71|nr:uncharacterized protein LOC110462891 [Mizuhopecten yessoensis]